MVRPDAARDSLPSAHTSRTSARNRSPTIRRSEPPMTIISSNQERTRAPPAHTRRGSASIRERWGRSTGDRHVNSSRPLFGGLTRTPTGHPFSPRGATRGCGKDHEIWSCAGSSMGRRNMERRTGDGVAGSDGKPEVAPEGLPSGAQKAPAADERLAEHRLRKPMVNAERET